MYDELPRAQILREFIEQANATTPNTPGYVAAQVFFQTRIMRLQKGGLTGTHPTVPEEQKATLRTLFLSCAGDVIDQMTQNSFQIAQDWEGMKARIPDTQKSAARVLDKLALQYGARPACSPMGNGK